MLCFCFFDLFFDFFYGFQRKAGTFGYVFHREAHGKQAEGSLIQAFQTAFLTALG